jgi:GTP pyrophosphokinase
MWRNTSGLDYTSTSLLENLEKYTHAEILLIHEALTLCHTKQLTNATLITRVAQVLVNQGSDAVVILSFLVAQVLWDQSISLAFIKKKFGRKVYRLLGQCVSPPTFRRSRDRFFIEDLQRVGVSLSPDIHLTTLLLAFILLDLQNTIAGEYTCSIEKADDVLCYAVPVTSILNLRRLRRELEDAAFRLLQPEDYANLKEQVAPLSVEDEQCLNILKTAIHRLLKKNGIKGEVQGRVKSLYSIYCKVYHSGRSLESILDRIGLRIIVHNVPECYRVLGILHSHFQPIPGSFDDYIGAPKENGYQSLHTCVYPVRDVAYKPIEFQIRTECMHKESESGSAAHWQYKRHRRVYVAGKRLQKIPAHKELVEAHGSSPNIDAFFQLLKQHIHDGSIVVFGREGRITQLPENTLLRHYLQKVGMTVSSKDRVKVNGSTVNLRHILKDGDSVEIISSVDSAEDDSESSDMSSEARWVVSLQHPFHSGC